MSDCIEEQPGIDRIRVALGYRLSACSLSGAHRTVAMTMSEYARLSAIVLYGNLNGLERLSI